MQVHLSGIGLEPPRHIPPPIRNWMLGQLLDASVIGRSGKNSIRLRLDGIEVRATTALPLQQGDKLTLKLTQLRPVITLSPAAAHSPGKARIRTAMNQALPKQQALAPLLDRMSVISQPATPRTGEFITKTRLPTALIQATHKVLRTIPSLPEISDAARLPAVLRRIGSFAESAVQYQDHVATKQTGLPEQDLKWQLLRLRGELYNTARLPAPKTRQPPPSTNPATGRPQPSVVPPTTAPEGPVRIASEPSLEVDSLRTLSQLVEGAIAKIETNQLKTVAALLDGDFRLVLDLPVAIEDTYEVVQLQISQEGPEGDDDASAATTIVIEVPVNADAVLRAVVTLSPEDLSIKLWSANLRLRQTIAAERETLEDRLRANGLAKVSISLEQLKPFEEWGKKFDTLIDVTA